MLRALGIVLGLSLLAGAAWAQNNNPAAVNGCVYNSPAVTLSAGQKVTFQCDNHGQLKISGSISATNPSVGSNGSAIPTSSTLIGAEDGSGNLQPVSAGNPLPITGSISASNPSVGSTGAAVPTSATFLGVNSGGNLVGLLGDASDRMIVVGPGTAGSPAGGVLTVQGISSMTPFLVTLQAGAALIGTVGIDQTTPGTTNGVQTLSGSTTAVTQATASSLNATVVGTGTFAVQDSTTETNTGTIAGAVSASVMQGNIKQVNGITTLAGTGNVGTGSIRVAVGRDTTTIAGSAPGTAGSASANVVTVQGVTSMTPVQVSQATAANLNATVVGTGTFAVQDSTTETNTGNTATSVATVAGAVTGSVMQSNVKQVNGVTTLAGAGAVGTGAQRVAVGQDTSTIAGSAPGTAGSASSNVVSVQGIASMTPFLANPGTAANWGVGATGSAPPANAVYAAASSGGNLTGIVTCGSHAFVHVTTATDTLLVQGVSAQTIKVCGALASFAGSAAQTIFLENTASTNANCSSTKTQITGAWTGNSSSPSNNGFYNSIWGGLANTSGNGLCVNSTGTGPVDLDIWYTQGS